MAFMVNSHGTERGAMYTRGEIVTVARGRELRVLHSLRRLLPLAGRGSGVAQTGSGAARAAAGRDFTTDGYSGRKSSG